MSLTVTIDYAKTQFPLLLEKVDKGEEIIITKDDKPVAQILPIKAKTFPNCRIPGTAKGEIIIADNFDEPLPDSILDTFEQ